MDVSHLPTSPRRDMPVPFQHSAQLNLHTQAQVQHHCRTRFSEYSLSPDDREITTCVVVARKIGCPTSINRCNPSSSVSQGTCCPVRTAQPYDLGRDGLSRVTPQKPWRCEVVPGEHFQCFVHVDRKLHHRPAVPFACELSVCSIQYKQIDHASAPEAADMGRAPMKEVHVSRASLGCDHLSTSRV